MSQTIAFNGTLEIAAGPKLSLNRSITVDAYDFIDVTIPAGTVDKVVSLQPGVTSDIRVLAITADWYGTALTYKINAVATVYTLEEPLVLTGKGALLLMGTDSPTTLKFSNSTSAANARDVRIQIIIGRNAMAH